MSDNRSKSNPERSPRKHKEHRDERPTHQISSEDYYGILSAHLERVADVASTGEFSQMIVDTVREGLLVLDLDLRVVAANESFYRVFEIRPEETLDRLVYNVAGGAWNVDELRNLLEKILPEKKAFSEYEVTVDSDEIGERIFLLNARQLDEHALILLTLENVTELRQSRRALEERVKERTREVRELASALTLAEQKERRRISQILHDDLQQILYGAQMKLKAAYQDVEHGDAATMQAHLTKIQELVERCVRVTRNLSVDLAPPLLHDEGLTDTINWIGLRMKELHGLDVRIKARNSLNTPDHDMRVLLFQVVRELLFNVVKHANTDAAEVEIRRIDHHVAITVSDEGEGFEVEAAETRASATDAFGLLGLRDRLDLFGGDLRIDSKPGEGTRVTVEVPLVLE